MKKGFTLVELLAVIVILAVIALITIPAVMKMIDTSTMNSYRRSVDLYGKAVTNGIISYESDMVEKGKKIDVSFQNIIDYIEYEGNDVECNRKIIYSDKTILLTECSVEDELVYGEKGRGYGEENYYYYTNSKKKMKLIEYIETVEEAIGDKNISGTCQVQEDKIVCNNEEITIKSKLENAIEGSLVIENNKVKSYNNLKFATEKKTETNNAVPQVIDEIVSEESNQNNNNGNDSSDQNNNLVEKYATLLNDVSPVGLSVGDKYSYKVNDNAIFNFYVLSIEGEKANLIMDNNICVDGKIPNNRNYSKCPAKWYSKADDNTKGPISAMVYLYGATKEWRNVPDMIMNYYDEGNKDDDSLGYKGIVTNNGQTKIIMKNDDVSSTIGSVEEPLKARLPGLNELTSLGCKIAADSCTDWIVDNLNNIIYGYWLLSSYNDEAYVIDRIINLNFRKPATGDVGIGLRPVITVPISYLQ